MMHTTGVKLGGGSVRPKTGEPVTITEFLLARIAEDEAAWNGGTDLATRPDFAKLSRHMLAECEAKRQVVTAVLTWTHEVVGDCWYTCAAAVEEVDGGECCDDARRGTDCDCGRDYRAGQILRPMAAAYAGHPDYDEAWRP